MRLPIQIDIAKNSIDTDTGIGISALLGSCYKFKAWWSHGGLSSNLKCLLYFCIVLKIVILGTERQAKYLCII